MKPHLPTLCTVRFDMEGQPVATVAKLIGFQHVCNMSGIRVLTEGRRKVYESSEWECDASSKPPAPRLLLRQERRFTRKQAEADCKKWIAEAEARKRELLKLAAAAEAANAAQRAALLPPHSETVRPATDNDAAKAEGAIRFSLCRKWPRSMAAITRRETDSEKLAAAYAADVAELTGNPDDAPIRLTAQVVAELARAIRNHATQTRKLASIETDLQIALNWLPLRWSELSNKRLEAALRGSGIEMTAGAARKRAGRMGLSCLKPRGPDPRAY